VVCDWLRRQERDALERLERARSARRLATGLDEVWSLALEGRIEHLVVEEHFEVPARIGADPHPLVRAADREAPDVVDDAVDELVEMVLVRGGRVTFVPDGLLDGHDHVAAALRY
jgi:hypothetical protein